ncbi:cell wall invertase 5 [Hibiscus trionum]|uniref:Cell wall invertase 5 n=1 Tax=Hibiscus trionum TaxID=183268 RepID=A0A9W7HYN5_HIBTR|nr:cell wall invertase 5 [Hibiscus trionum]
MAKSCIVVLFIFIAVLASHGIVELEASHHVYRNLRTARLTAPANQPYRTGYHFQPPKNWINGLMVYKGLYHLFYQYNPQGAVWGHIVWAHSTSKDFVNWVQAPTPLRSAQGTGMWDCPDFYPVPLRGRNGVDNSLNVPSVKHVLKVSLDDTKHDFYTIGSYDRSRDVYVPDKGSVENDSGLRYDYGKYYASKTFLDSIKNRRVLCGWLNESSSVADDIKKGWAGVHAIPRQIWLDKSGKQLIQWRLPSKLLKRGSVVEVSGVTASQADVDISFEITGFEKAEMLNPSWTNLSSYAAERIDHSIVESFGGGGKACISARVYPTLAINNDAHLYVFNNGSQAVKIAKLNAWSMNKAKIN